MKDKDKDNGVATKIMTVTPKQAQEWLDRSEPVRRIWANVVSRYADAMRDGRWRLTGQGVGLDKAGRLLNGFHRCSAVVEAGVSIRIEVTTGLDPKDITVMDEGRRRRLIDFLGCSNPNEVCAGLRHLWRYRHDELGKTFFHQTVLSIPQGLTLYRSVGKQFDAATLRVCRLRKMKSCAPVGAQILVAYLGTMKMGEDVVDDWFEKLRTGVSLGKDDPIHRLRERFFKDQRVGGGASTAKLPMKAKEALYFKAWNLWVVGESCRNLAWRAQGKSAEPFPVPQFPEG